MNFLHVYTGMKRLWWLVFSLHYMRSITLHEFLKHMLAKASAGWSIACTTWVSFTLHGFFECIYRNQTTSWPISDLHYMRSITLHELFARVYWNETPLIEFRISIKILKSFLKFLCIYKEFPLDLEMLDMLLTRHCHLMTEKIPVLFSWV